MVHSDRWNTLTLIGYKTFSELGSKLSTFFLLILASRFLTTTEFGMLSLGFATGWIVSVMTDFGLQMHLARETAKEPHKSGPLYRRLLILRLLLVGLAVAAVALLGLLWGRDYLGSFILIVVSQVLTSLIELINHFYRGLAKTQIESTVNLLHRIATLIAGAVMLVSTGSLFWLSAGLLVVSVVSLLFSYYYSLRLVPAREQGQEPSFETETFFRDVFPIGLGILLSVLYFRIDLYLLEMWQGLETVALYNAVFRLVEALRFIPAAVLAVIFPELCRRRQLTLLSASTLLLGLSAVAISIIAIWQSELLIRLTYGVKFEAAGPAFRILMLALPFLFVNFVLTHQIIAWDLHRFFAFFCSAGLALNLGLNLLLIPEYGSNGAALSTVGTEIALTGAWSWVLLRKRDFEQGRDGMKRWEES